jgi:hypothetical protein
MVSPSGGGEEVKSVTKKARQFEKYQLFLGRTFLEDHNSKDIKNSIFCIMIKGS